MVIPQDHIYSVVGHSKRGRRIPLPALCRASRRLRAETLPIWRSNNTFTHGRGDIHGNDPRKWLMELARSGLEHIEVLEMEAQVVVHDPRQGRHAVSISVVVMKEWYHASITWMQSRGKEWVERVVEDVATKKINSWMRVIELATNRKIDPVVDEDEMEVDDEEGDEAEVDMEEA